MEHFSAQMPLLNAHTCLYLDYQDDAGILSSFICMFPYLTDKYQQGKFTKMYTKSICLHIITAYF